VRVAEFLSCTLRVQLRRFMASSFFLVLLLPAWTGRRGRRVLMYPALSLCWNAGCGLSALVLTSQCSVPVHLVVLVLISLVLQCICVALVFVAY
jgi:hypothetical protein